MSNDVHVILGAGQIGSRLAEVLLAKGHRVRLVRKGPARTTRPNLEYLSGDITDLGFAERAARNAAVVYDCMNPPYHMWPELLLPIARGALHGAEKAGAKLVALDCLYMYGRPVGAMHEDSVIAPCSKKGALRVRLAELRMEAHRQGRVPVAVGRASDFFGSDLPYSLWNPRFFERVFAGRAAECMGDPDMLHAYTYAPDIARALATLGERDEAMGRIWILPTHAAESTRALVQRLGRALHLDGIQVTRVPKWLVRAMGVFNPFMREVVEMMYQWEVPFTVDDSRFRETFGYGPTPLDEAVAEVASWALTRRASFAPSRSLLA
ncbi:NAD-dependent epimerase/dehydratase family protein [Pendulispora brunnea]|uniref:NAD-dependent epimerase/dehydratase family protein n=1 Tax=Pendulispora brunnea TaxID=2905690 RepID=A0ABZ2K6S2_9BACT